LFTILNETVNHTFYTLLLIAICSFAIETANKRLGVIIPLTEQWDTDQRAYRKYYMIENACNVVIFTSDHRDFSIISLIVLCLKLVRT